MIRSKKTGSRFRTVSIALKLVVITVLGWVVLRGGSLLGTATQSETESVRCEQQVAKLVTETGGQGPEYKAGFDALPPSCQRMLPAPDALEPSAKRAEPET